MSLAHVEYQDDEIELILVERKRIVSLIVVSTIILEDKSRIKKNNSVWLSQLEKFRDHNLIHV